MSTSSTDPSARTPIPPVLPAEDLSGASGDLGLFAGRLPGVREYSRSACGELVPFRRVDWIRRLLLLAAACSPQFTSAM